MQLYYSIFFCCSLFFLNGEAEASKSKHRFKAFKTKQQRTVEANQQLEKASQTLGKDNWQKRQAIIRHAVNHRVHPDDLRSLPGDNTTPLFDCVVAHNDEDGLRFAEFLLQRGANARAMHRTSLGAKPLICFVETVAMAQLLVNYGARRDVQAWGPALLNEAWAAHREAALIPFFVSHGARIDVHAGGELPLMSLIQFTHNQPLEDVVPKVRSFMEQGVPLNLRYQQTQTVPKFIKREIEAQNRMKERLQDPKACDTRITHLQTIRQTLIDEEQKRNIRFCMDAVPCLLPSLQAIVGAYGGPGKSYQDLEDEPIAGAVALNSQSANKQDE
jgi:hypothetical protein